MDHKDTLHFLIGKRGVDCIRGADMAMMWSSSTSNLHMGFRWWPVMACEASVYGQIYMVVIFGPFELNDGVGFVGK